VLQALSRVKKEEVSQDDSFLEGHQKAAYAVDEHGNYVVVPSRGYADEVVATTVALLTQDRLIQTAWERARNGELSPLAYHLAVKHWTLGLAAAQMGIGRWRVWWHLRPAGFRRLSAALKSRYSEQLDVPLQELSVVPEAPELTMGGG
jgi:hypothetical protein